MVDLTFLGSFPDEPPLVTWPGHSDLAREHLFDLTGVRLEPFTLSNGDDHDQYYFSRGVESARNSFFELTEAAQRSLIEELYADYYKHARELERLTDLFASTDFYTQGAEELATALDRWMVGPSMVAGPIFYSLLLDLWLDDLENIRDALEIAADARDHCGRVYDVAFKPQADELFNAIADRLDIEPTTLRWLFPEEIHKTLRGETFDTAVVADRQEFFVTETRGGLYSIFAGDSAVVRASEVALVQDEASPSSDLAGIAAYGGKVEGRARVIRSTTEFETFRAGEILVAKQTSKPWEPLFERASAILTQIGGELSHAAKVSREIQKPCVVGIGNLLVSVQTGDYVTVDATAGAVHVERRLDDERA